LPWTAVAAAGALPAAAAQARGPQLPVQKERHRPRRLARRRREPNRRNSMPDTRNYTPSEDDIRRRAYEIYLRRGGEHRYGEDDGRAAERDLTGGAAEVPNTRGVAAAAGAVAAGIPQGAHHAPEAKPDVSNPPARAAAAAAGAGAGANAGKQQRTPPR